jgi:hypothetical protein
MLFTFPATTSHGNPPGAPSVCVQTWTRRTVDPLGASILGGREISLEQDQAFEVAEPGAKLIWGRSGIKPRRGTVFETHQCFILGEFGFLRIVPVLVF